MKIESGRGISSSSSAPKAGGASAAPGFAPAVDAPQRMASTGPVSAVTPLDAIIALQSEEPPARRRARQAKRGKDALDALEKLEQGLLSGRAPASLKAELETLHFASQPTGDAALDEILLEIDIRLAVEAAKLESLAHKA